MNFSKITNNNNLWAVVYEGERENALQKVLNQWSNAEWLHTFFVQNVADLEKYFKITDINKAIFHTMEEGSQMESVILELDENTELDSLFKHLENSRMAEMMLSKEKAKGERLHIHPSWLRIYAIRLEANTYIITGGAIKLTWKMEDRAHTLYELEMLEKVRNHLISMGVVDKDSFIDYYKEP